MSSQTFEILCPVCDGVVPADATGCPHCAEARGRELEETATAAQRSRAAEINISGMALKDYHRLVQANYQAVAGRAVTRPRSRRRVAAYLPFVLMVLFLIVGAGVIFMH